LESPEKPIITCAQPLAVFGADMFALAEQYLDAFSALKVKENVTRLRPAYFLLSHATELALKSFLVNMGYDHNSIFKLNHNMKRIHVEATNNGLLDVPQLNLLIDHLADMNDENSLRYPAYQFISVPDAEECAEVCRTLLGAIGPRIKRAGFVAMMKLRARHPGCDFSWVGPPQP
jgi:hypothetical protein